MVEKKVKEGDGKEQARGNTGGEKKESKEGRKGKEGMATRERSTLKFSTRENEVLNMEERMQNYI